jgi:hypothetical protein
MNSELASFNLEIDLRTHQDANCKFQPLHATNLNSISEPATVILMLYRYTSQPTT